MNIPYAKSNLISDSGEARAEAAPAAGDCLQGASPSNTAPHNSIWTDDVVLLRSGVDTLQLSFRGELFEESEIQLRELKGIAQAESRGEQAYAQWELCGELFSVLSRGSGRFPYTLISPSYRLSLSDGKGSMPLAFVQIQSEVLTKSGVESCIEAITGIISKVASTSDSHSISRIDICLDFATNYDMESISRHDWVTRAKRISQYVEGNAFTGWSLGLKGAVACRLYDKTAEILVSGKPYMRELWMDCGWDGSCPVWRLEFEVKREALVQFDVASLATRRLCAGLWDHLTHSWLRLAIPSESDVTRSRWETHPLWRRLQTVDFGALDTPSLQRVQKSSSPGHRWMFGSGGSGISAFMAAEGIDDFLEGCKQYGIAYLEYRDQFSEFRGTSSEEFVLEKVKFLRRKHNLAVNQRPGYQYDPVKASIARHYAKGKDGE
jgi:hypothetical protein